MHFLRGPVCVIFLQVAYNVADNVPKLVICDAQRLQQVLLNVLNNAVKFTEKGEVLLEVWCEPQDERLPQQDVAEWPQDLSEAAPDSCDRGDKPQVLLGHVSKDSGQQVQVNGPALEEFRPLTPDNLSQHTELAEMRQQVQGPAPGFAQHAAGRCGALALSFNMCSQGEHCSCLPAKDDARSETLIAAVQQQTPGMTSSPHKDTCLMAASEQRGQLHQQQQDTQQRLNPYDTFTAASPSNTSAGQQHILATSSAAASASVQANPPAASSTHHADAPGAPSSSAAGEAAKERSGSDSRRRHAMDGCEERTQARRHDSHASTSGRSHEDASHYTLNFSVRDSGIGISDENLDNLFQCFCQVISNFVYTNIYMVHTVCNSRLVLAIGVVAC